MFFFSGTIAKYIHVTQNSIGRDQAECGSRTAPCKTVEYAVSISKSFEVILIDGGHEQQYEYELTDTLLIDKELTLRSSNASRRAILRMKFDLHRYKFLIALFNITKNFTLNAVNLKINQTALDFADVALVLISASHINVTLTDNIFRNIRPQFSFISRVKANVVMKNCVVESAPFLLMSSIKSTFRSNSDDSGKNLSTVKRVNIKVNQCNFRKSYVMLWL